MGYRSEVAYMVKFHSKDEPEKAHADYLKFQEWVKTKHRVIKNEEVEHKLSINPEVYTYEDAVKDFNSEQGGDFTFKWYDADNTLCMHASWIKWYESYAEIQWHERLMHEVATYETGGYRFIRVGEEDQDIEAVGHNEGDTDLFEKLYVSRVIEFHPPSESQDKEAV